MSAIAVQRTENVAINTAGMDTDQNIRFSRYFAMYKRKVRFSVDFAAVLDRLEMPELCPDTSLRFSPDKLFRLGAIPDQLRH